MKNSDTAMLASKEKESSNSIFPENTDADKFQPAAPSGSVVNEVLKPHMSSLATEDDQKEDTQMAPNGSRDQKEHKTSGQCAYCQKEAFSACNGCAEASRKGGSGLGTWYCDAACQKAHWTVHKTLCKTLQARLQVHRAALVLQLARYAYREQVFDLSIKKVEKKGDDLYVYEGDYAPETMLVPFPESLVEGNDKRGLLTLLTCEDAIAYMEPFIRRLLEGETSSMNGFNSQLRWLLTYVGHLGCYTRIEEVSIKLKNHRPIIYFNGLGDRHDMDCEHHILRVTTKGGEMIALDITCAQYGWQNPVMSWELYLQERVSQVKRILPFGYARSCLQQKIQTDTHGIRGGYRIDTIQAAVWTIHAQASKVFDRLLQGWMDEKNKSHKSLLLSREDVFLKDVKQLLGIASVGLRLGVRILETGMRTAPREERAEPGKAKDSGDLGDFLGKVEKAEISGELGGLKTVKVGNTTVVKLY